MATLQYCDYCLDVCDPKIRQGKEHSDDWARDSNGTYHYRCAEYVESQSQRQLGDLELDTTDVLSRLLDWCKHHHGQGTGTDKLMEKIVKEDGLTVLKHHDVTEHAAWKEAQAVIDAAGLNDRQWPPRKESD